MTHMNLIRIVRGIVIAIVALVAMLALVAVFGFAVMYLWNWLVPAIVGWKSIDFWQALGLLVLSRILFGFRLGFGGRGHWRGRWRGRWGQRWAQMTPEEREKFREAMRARCGGRWKEPETTGGA
jgi:hypothetical protein